MAARPLPLAQRRLRRGREDECRDLRWLLLTNRARRSRTEIRVADRMSTACLGREHLWQDMGLASRHELSSLIATHFPRLKALNQRDMKWKKFFYRRLCDLDGGHICRAPTCEACADFDGCFGPEE